MSLNVVTSFKMHHVTCTLQRQENKTDGFYQEEKIKLV